MEKSKAGKIPIGSLPIYMYLNTMKKENRKSGVIGFLF